MKHFNNVVTVSVTTY